MLDIDWHVRSGNISSNINKSNLVSHVVVHVPSYTDNVTRMFESFSNVNLFSSTNLRRVVCSFLKADILMTTGSSFPGIISWFAPQHRPLIIQDIRNGAVGESAVIKYAVRSSDSICMESGVLLQNTTTDIFKAIEIPGVSQRLKLSSK